MGDIWQTALAIIGSFGGAGVIVFAIIKFSSEKISERLSAKYQLKLDKELAGYRSKLENKTFISRAMFEKEFTIYQDLINKFYEAYPHLEAINGISQKRIISESEIKDDNPNLEDLWQLFQKNITGEELQMEDTKIQVAGNLRAYKKAVGASGGFIPYENQRLFLDIWDTCYRFMFGKNEETTDWNDVLTAIEKMQVELRQYLNSLKIID